MMVLGTLKPVDYENAIENGKNTLFSPYFDDLLYFCAMHRLLTSSV